MPHDASQLWHIGPCRIDAAKQECLKHPLTDAQRTAMALGAAYPIAQCYLVLVDIMGVMRGQASTAVLDRDRQMARQSLWGAHSTSGPGELLQRSLEPRKTPDGLYRTVLTPIVGRAPLAAYVSVRQDFRQPGSKIMGMFAQGDGFTCIERSDGAWLFMPALAWAFDSVALLMVDLGLGSYEQMQRFILKLPYGKPWSSPVLRTMPGE